MSDHDQIAKRAAALIRKLHGCTIGALNYSGGWNPERVDAILFNSRSSFLIEAKVSRSDFLADKKKLSRIEPSRGVGRYRYYACPPDLISATELPAKWGLIYIGGRGEISMPIGYGGCVKIGEEKREGQYWLSPIYKRYGTFKGETVWPEDGFSFEDRCMHLERDYLFHLATRYKRQKFMENIL